MKRLMNLSSPLFLLFLLFAFTSCNHLFYHPNRFAYSDPRDFHYQFENISIPSTDGVKLHAWHFKNKSKEKTKGLILFFHGNAQNITSHYFNMAWASERGLDVIVVDYRGYGLSTGKATSQGIYDDSIAALHYSYNHFKKNKWEKFIVYGQSLGGNIALRGVASLDPEMKKNIDLLVLDSTFLSYKDIAFNRLASFWGSWAFSPLAFILVSDKYAPLDYAQKIKIPVLVIHGENDHIIPKKFGEEVFATLPMGKKTMWMIPNGKHIDIFSSHGKVYKDKFINFIEI